MPSKKKTQLAAGAGGRSAPAPKKRGTERQGRQGLRSRPRPGWVEGEGRPDRERGCQQQPVLGRREGRQGRIVRRLDGRRPAQAGQAVGSVRLLGQEEVRAGHPVAQPLSGGGRLDRMPEPAALAAHSAYSDPGPYAGLLRDLPDDVAALNATARNVIAHYRAELTDLAEDRRGEIDSRWLQTILATDQARHGTRLTEPRPLAERVAGCCRDHTLFVVGALRERGVPARSRVGFAGYFTPGYFHDHVIVEHHDGARWLAYRPRARPRVRAVRSR